VYVGANHGGQRQCVAAPLPIINSSVVLAGCSCAVAACWNAELKWLQCEGVDYVVPARLVVVVPVVSVAVR